jgi:hypothetical protein
VQRSINILKHPEVFGTQLDVHDPDGRMARDVGAFTRLDVLIATGVDPDFMGDTGFLSDPSVLSSDLGECGVKHPLKWCNCPRPDLMSMDPAGPNSGGRVLPFAWGDPTVFSRGGQGVFDVARCHVAAVPAMVLGAGIDGQSQLSGLDPGWQWGECGWCFDVGYHDFVVTQVAALRVLTPGLTSEQALRRVEGYEEYCVRRRDADK